VQHSPPTECNFAHDIVPRGKLYETALGYCKYLAAQEPGSPELIRPIIRLNLINKLRLVNREECDICEKKWVSYDCFKALSAYLESRKMYSAALVLKFANATGLLWGQPK